MITNSDAANTLDKITRITPIIRAFDVSARGGCRVQIRLICARLG
jgi:hypothetical protein